MINIVRNALRPGYGAEMLRKLSLRLREGGTGRRTEASDWCRRRQVDARAWARSIDERLWDEASAFAREQRKLAARKSQELGLPVGGAGFYELLYFLVRVHRPETIVETGVAFGFSSRAFLCALDENASADATPMSRPVVRRRAVEEDARPGGMTGTDAVEAVMGGIRLSGVKAAYTGDSSDPAVRSQRGFHS